MPRWYIIKTLWKKEALRYRYNWGLLVLVFTLLALAALLSVSDRFALLPGQTNTIRRCVLLLPPGSKEASLWADFLMTNAPEEKQVQSFFLKSSPPQIPPGAIGIELPASLGDTAAVKYWYPESAEQGLLACRDWFTEASGRYLQQRPRLVEESRELARRDVTPFIFTGIMVFALYILSFNLYITSTGEEREKRLLLALLLSPATAAELILAKLLFYCGASLFVSALIVAMYKPALLLQPVLWGALFFGSVGYLSIGTVVLCLIRRQTTLSTVSMLYMLMTTMVTFLGSFQVLFYLLQYLFVEGYLYRQIFQLFSNGYAAPWLLPTQAVIAFFWVLVALWLFRRRGLSG